MGFNNVVGEIDGLVICTVMPTLLKCEAMNCQQSNKDECGLNLQGICDHKQ